MLGSCQIVETKVKSVRRVERQLGVERRRDGVAGDAAQAQRVAVGRRLGERVHADIAAGAALVLDDPLLAGEFGHLGAEHARQRVGRAAGRERVDVADGLVGIGALGTTRPPGRRGSPRQFRPRRYGARSDASCTCHFMFPPFISAGRVPKSVAAVDGEAGIPGCGAIVAEAGLATAFQMSEKSRYWVTFAGSADGFGGCPRWQEDGHVGF